MTVIVCNGECMAADTQVTWDNGEIHHTHKIFRVGKKLIGVCGNAAETIQYVEYLKGKRKKKPKVEDITVLELSDKGKYIRYCKDGDEKILTDYAAIGSGGDAAKAAMIMGATPEEAVLIACKINAACGCHDKPQVEYL